MLPLRISSLFLEETMKWQLMIPKSLHGLNHEIRPPVAIFLFAQVTTFHRSIENLQKAVPSARVLKNTRYVDNGRVITTAGISAGIDGALHLVAKLRGKEAAMKVAQHMEYDKYVPEQGLVVH